MREFEIKWTSSKKPWFPGTTALKYYHTNFKIYMLLRPNGLCAHSNFHKNRFRFTTPFGRNSQIILAWKDYTIRWGNNIVKIIIFNKNTFFNNSIHIIKVYLLNLFSTIVVDWIVEKSVFVDNYSFFLSFSCV